MLQDFYSLLKFDSQELDRQLWYHCPFLSLILPESLFKQVSDEECQVEDPHVFNQGSQESDKDKTDSHHSLSQDQSSEASASSADRPNRSPQQTKNFLQNFKHHHLNHLSNYLNLDLSSYKIIRDLRAKSGINRQDYLTLYKEPDLQEAFEEMFASRYLYQMLKLSKCKSRTKEIHQSNLFVFEDAFQSKTFPKIKMYCLNFH